MPRPASRIAMQHPGGEPPDDLQLAARPASLTDVVLAAIRDAILSKSIAPGQRVTEASLAERLNVSKTPVREALMELRQMGLVESSGARGDRVIGPSRAAIQQAAQVRDAVEPYLAGEAAKTADEQQCKLLAHAARRTKIEAERGNQAAFDEWNLRFHSIIADIVGNPRLTKLQADNFAVNSLLRLRDLRPENRMVEFADDHREIARHIKGRDPEAAHAAARQHAQGAGAYNLANFDRSWPGDGKATATLGLIKSEPSE